MLTCPNLELYLRTAIDDPLMHSRGIARMALAIAKGGLLERQERKGLRISDAGACRRELWYKEHGLADLPVDPINLQLLRYDEGSLNGAWYACLIAEAAIADGWNVELEEVVSFGGHPGHIDMRLWHYEFAANPAWEWQVRSHVVEIKTKYETGAIRNPEKEMGFQLLQADAYCLNDDPARQSQTFSLLVVSASSKKGARIQQFDFEAEPLREQTENDFMRLEANLEDDEPPDGDPKEVWRCYTCCASACAMNKNKAKNSSDVLFD